MSKGDLALVLHAHLPYVRSAQEGSLEEDWFFQALMECYLPLLEKLENSANSIEENPKITIGLSPTLLSLLGDLDLKARFPSWINCRVSILKEVEGKQTQAANFLIDKITHQLEKWQACDGNLINRFAELQRKNVVDLLTCAATHGYLPLLRESPSSVRGQIKTAVIEHQRLIGCKPFGIWLPECAYYEGLDEIMFAEGLRYAVLDSHGLLHAKPRPRYGIYAPICTKNGIAFFARDSESTLPVWSAKDGYPGDPNYREFHKDLGWELPIETLKRFGINEHRPLGLKLNKVTSRGSSLDEKDIYDPEVAAKLVKLQAKHYLIGRKQQLDSLAKTMNKKALLVAPFDAELFGHWWFEGPEFLSEIFKQSKKEEVNLTRLRDVLNTNSNLQLCSPSPSSWGQGGYHDYWLNSSNSWIVPKWSEANKEMIEISKLTIFDKFKKRLHKQLARELLLAQSSDWSFILRAGTTTDLAKERINTHLNRFWMLSKAIKGEIKISIEKLEIIENEDRVFPEINPEDWSL